MPGPGSHLNEQFGSEFDPVSSHFIFRSLLVITSAFGLALGFALIPLGMAAWQRPIWVAFTLPVLIALLFEIVSSLRRGDVGLDIVAALSMMAALAVGEELAAIVVALMYSGGQYLEAFAERHARREMTALLARVPRNAMRHRCGKLEEIALEDIQPGDRLLIRQGDVVPVDGTIAANCVAVLDQSALTGEPIPVQRHQGDDAMSGSTNAGEAFDLVASRRAAESTYAGIVRLVEEAQRSKAPISRLADRFAMVFLLAAVLIAGAAWAWSDNPVRAVAVLVAATPCPLILAVPVAMVSGLSRAAKQGILIKGGKAIEALTRVSSLVIDKTGTLTDGRAKVVSVTAVATVDTNVLRIVASLDQASKHIIAQTIVAEAHRRDLHLSVPTRVIETPGEGIQGIVEGRTVIVGGLPFVMSKLPRSVESSRKTSRRDGSVVVGVAIDGEMAGHIVLADELRAGIQALLKRLRELGIERIILATGDRREVAETLTSGLSIDAVRAELTPDQKVLVVLSERKNGPVMMVGDGVNDAPALAAADVGVAMGARGNAASAQAADVVLLVDQLDKIVPAIQIARHSRHIALESVFAGIGLSLLAMIAAAFGYLQPVQGALLQEVIDVAVILNALRALGSWSIT